MSGEESPQAGSRLHSPGGRHLAALWFSMAAGPLAWVLGLNVGYSLVLPACAQETMLWLHLVSAATLLLAAAGVVVGVRGWRRSGGNVASEFHGRSLPLDQFMAALGVIGSAFFALVILAQWAGNFILNPCMGI